MNYTDCLWWCFFGVLIGYYVRGFFVTCKEMKRQRELKEKENLSGSSSAESK